MSGAAGPDPRLVASAAHVFVADLGAPVLGDDDRHHLLKVLRIRAGEPVTVSDGRGAWRACRMGAGGSLEPDSEVVSTPAPPYDITVAFVPPKGDRPELIVQKLTEIGVDRIVVMRSDHGVVRWDDERAAKQLVRLRRIMTEAAMQSRRSRLPVLDGPKPFEEVATTPFAVLAAPGGDPVTSAARTFLVGPEGGWSDAELRRPLSRVGLGETVLRAETAALVSCALAVSVRAELVANGR